jgi:hypothetical protein
MNEFLKMPTTVGVLVGVRGNPADHLGPDLLGHRLG